MRYKTYKVTFYDECIGIMKPIETFAADLKSAIADACHVAKMIGEDCSVYMVEEA